MLVLASQSPRRRELLKRILGDRPFDVEPAKVDERAIHDKDCAHLVLEEALLKGMDVSSRRKGDLVLSSDTMVVFEGEQLGKPNDEEDAFDTLKRLQGKEHQILTGYALIEDGKVLKKGVVSASLYIEPMDDAAIWRYVKTKSPLDKAGSYGVQDKEYLHSKITEGYMENIMGLPVREIERDLRELKIID